MGKSCQLVVVLLHLLNNSVKETFTIRVVFLYLNLSCLCRKLRNLLPETASPAPFYHVSSVTEI